jgi:hypothetical protein
LSCIFEIPRLLVFVVLTTPTIVTRRRVLDKEGAHARRQEA